MSGRFVIAAMEFTEDQVAITIIRDAVMPKDDLISKVETLTTSRRSFSRRVMRELEEFVEVVLEGYDRGLHELPAVTQAPDDDSDSIGLQ